MIVRVEVEVRPTEDKGKVIKALKNLFNIKTDDIEETKEGLYTRIIVVSEGGYVLNKLYHMLRMQRILDAARQYLTKGKKERSVIFYLNKQAAYMGKVSFCSFEYGESPLGAIVINIETGDPDRLIDWLSPPTSKGVPIEKVKSPPGDP